MGMEADAVGSGETCGLLIMMDRRVSVGPLRVVLAPSFVGQASVAVVCLCCSFH